jgi:hypothetical protein
MSFSTSRNRLDKAIENISVIQSMILEMEDGGLEMIV